MIMPKCKFCQGDISWKYAYGETPPGEKNLPLNLDGSLHDCRTKTDAPSLPTIARVTPEQMIITELTKHTHLLEEILEALTK